MTFFHNQKGEDFIPNIILLISIKPYDQSWIFFRRSSVIKKI